MVHSVLIIGLGNIGMAYDLQRDPEKFVLSHARAFQQHAQFQLVAGVDLDSERCRMFEERYNCASYTDLNKAIDETNPSVVVVSNPTDQHVATILDVLRLGPPVLFCVKNLWGFQLIKLPEL